MAFTDPQSITISGTTTSLPATSVGGNSKEYTSADGLLQLVMSHTYGRRTRRVARLNHSKYAASVSNPATNQKYGISIYTVFDVEPYGQGFTNADVLASWVGFNTLLTASTNAAVSKLLGGES